MVLSMGQVNRRLVWVGCERRQKKVSWFYSYRTGFFICIATQLKKKVILTDDCLVIERAYVFLLIL